MKIIWKLIAYSIIFFAVLISLARFFIPNINEQRTEIEQLLSEQLGVMVTIGSIHGEWQALGPNIVINDFTALSATANTPLIKVGQLHIELATISSLFSLEPVTEQINIYGLKIAFTQNHLGQFSLDGLHAKQSKTIAVEPASDTLADSKLADNLVDWLQNQQVISIRDLNIGVTLKNKRNYPIHVDQLLLERGKNMYQLTGMTSLPDNNSLDFVMETDGFLTHPNTKGKLYVTTHKVKLSEMPSKAFWDQVDISSGTIEAEVWANWHNRAFQSAIASINLENFLLLIQEEPQSSINKYQGHLVWQNTGNGWIVETQNTQLISDDRTWPDPKLRLTKSMQTDSQQLYNLYASRLDIGIWADLLLTNPNLEKNLRNQLLAMEPDGSVDDVQVIASIKDNEIVDLQAHGRFTEISFLSYQELPGVERLTGQFEVFEDSGKVILDSRNTLLDYPSLFRWPFQIDYLNGRFEWSNKPEQLTLNIKRLNLELNDLQLRADGQVLIGDFAPELNLYAEIAQAELKHTSKFLPISVMQPDLIVFLDNALVDGKLAHTKALVRGPLDQFPFYTEQAGQNGVFAIAAKLKQAEINFDDSWPNVQQADGLLTFLGNGMNIELSSAKAAQVEVNAVTANIANFSATPSTLELTLNTDSQAEFVYDYLYKTPLVETLSGVLEQIPTQGPISGNLALSIPLDDDSETKLSGKVKLLGNKTQVTSIDMPVTQVKGTLNFKNNLISGTGLTANLMGGAATFNLEQQLDQAQRLTTELTATGEFAIASVREIFPSLIPKPLLGKSNYQMQLSFPENDQGTQYHLQLDTDLIGVTSEYPAPFDKAANSPESFSLTIDQLPEQPQKVALQFGQRINGKIAIDEQQTLGQVMLGNAQASWPEFSLEQPANINVTGELAQIQLESWLSFIKQQADSSEEQSSSDDFSLFTIDKLLINQFDYEFLSFNKVLVSADFGDGFYRFGLDSDAIKGNVQIPDQQGIIQVNLDSMLIADQFPPKPKPELKPDLKPELKPEESQETAISVTRSASSTALPEIDIYCKACVYNKQPIGEVNLKLRPLEHGNRFELTTKGAPLLETNLTGKWQADSEGLVNTDLKGTLKSHKFGRLMRTFNLESGLHGTPVTINGDLSWAGDLAQINSKTIRGKLTMDAGKGNQEDLSDKKARVFTLFSVGSIARKLTLDFSDLFNDGFFYDGMKGSFTINQGVVATRDFKVDGLSAQVEIKGQTDFNNMTLKKCVLVVPDLSSSLPILAGWAIEPVTGLLVYLMSKIFEPALKVVTSILYKVEGPVDNPEVVELKKTDGTAKVDKTSGEQPIITAEPIPTEFNCDKVFNN